MGNGVKCTADFRLKQLATAADQIGLRHELFAE
jgi:hypothetical protein